MPAPELPILYCDDDLVAVHKPAGMLVHRTYLSRREKYFALQLLRDQLGERVYPLHRLDRPTSGVLLFARRQEVAATMGGLFRDGGVAKTYKALVRGWTEPQGEIDYPLVDPDADLTGKCDARDAVTAYRKLAQVEIPMAVGRYPTSRYALLELHPRQGRRHQLRRHLKHIFHPIVGDINYGDGRHNRFFRERYACHRLLLAATHLKFHHPHSGVPVVIECPLEASFEQLMRQLEWCD